MNDPALFYTILVGSALCSAGYYAVQYFSLYRAKKAQFPEDWRAHIARRVAIYDKLAPNLQHQLEQEVKVFVHKKRFIGCAGLQIDDEIRVTIAANACLLLLNRETENYPRLNWIYVYPADFVVRYASQRMSGLPPSENAAFFGEAWERGSVFLTWDRETHALSGFCSSDPAPATQESFVDNGSESQPIPPVHHHTYKCWSLLLAEEIEGASEVLSTEGNDDFEDALLLDSFAEATESFYEAPETLAKTQPELFAQLKAHYNVDPREWVA